MLGVRARPGVFGRISCWSSATRAIVGRRTRGCGEITSNAGSTRLASHVTPLPAAEHAISNSPIRAPSPDARVVSWSGSWFRSGAARFVGAAKDGSLFGQANPETLPEVAFAGRSNVGKSTLLNAMMRLPLRQNVSKVPGKTRGANFFAVGDRTPRMVVADLPGYGYSRASKKERAALHDLIRDYCASAERAPVLRRVMLLADCRQGLSDIDREFMLMMEAAEMEYQVVLTKADSLGQSEMADILLRTVSELGLPTYNHCYPLLSVVSGKSGFGVEQLRQRVVQAAVGLHLPSQERGR